MPDTFHVVTQAPVVATIAGQQVAFPVLEIDDLLPWCAELKELRKRIGKKNQPANMPSFDRWRADKWMDENEPTLDELTALVRTPGGGKRVLLLSLAKAGRAADEAKIVAAAVPPYMLAQLASDVSALFPPNLSAAGPDGAADPNAGAGGDAGEGSTGAG